MHASILPALALATVALTAVPAHAQECAPTDAVDPLRLVRQTSLDLRGTLPSFEELDRVRLASFHLVGSLRLQQVNKPHVSPEALL